MEIFGKIGETLVNVGKDATQKAKDLSGAAKLNLDIKSKEDFVQKQFAELGKIYYQVHEGEENVEGAEHFELIAEAMAAIDKMKLELQGLKGTKVCPKCGEEVSEGAEYCSTCGEKLPIVVDTEATEVEHTEEE